MKIRIQSKATPPTAGLAMHFTNEWGQSGWRKVVRWAESKKLAVEIDGHDVRFVMKQSHRPFSRKYGVAREVYRVQSNEQVRSLTGVRLG